MKISEAGPDNQRIEPHLLGLSKNEHVNFTGRIKVHKHPLSGSYKWYAPARFSYADIEEKLDHLVSVRARTLDRKFTDLLGDTLEISVFKILQQMNKDDRRFRFVGGFDLSNRNDNGHFPKISAPPHASGRMTYGDPDFLIYHPAGETLLVECKNIREWVNPSNDKIKQVIGKALDLDAVPVFITRRLPWVTKFKFCKPAGIIAHETYKQLYPDTPGGHALAAEVKKVRGLGYFDVIATEEQQDRTVKFFEVDLPGLITGSYERFQTHKADLRRFVDSEITWGTLNTILNGTFGEYDAGPWDLND